MKVLFCQELVPSKVPSYLLQKKNTLALASTNSTMHIILKVMHTIFFIIIPSLIPHAVFEEDVGSSGSRALDAPGMSDPPAKKK